MKAFLALSLLGLFATLCYRVDVSALTMRQKAVRIALCALGLCLLTWNL